MMKTAYSIFTNKGGRPVNEDFADFAVRGGAYCFVLCDGLGGHGMGDRASRFVARFVLDEFRSRAGDFVSTVLPRAQEALRLEQEHMNSVGKMKTTVVVLVIEGSRGYCLHLGDSRLYRFRDGRIVSQTRDHSVPQMLVLTGEITADRIRSHPDRNKLLRALGDDRKELKYEQVSFDVQPGDAFLLCSDGFWEPVTENEMLRLLSEQKTAKGWLNAMAELAVQNSAGKKMDNYTAVTVRIN